MARINFEKRLYEDPRWKKLLIKAQDEYRALGLLVSAWALSQSHWIKHKAIPEKAWPKELNLLIETEFAYVRDDGMIYVKGSKRQFAWLEQRSKAGSSRTEKKIESAKKARAAQLNDRSGKQAKNLNGRRTESNGGEPPYSLLISHNSLLTTNSQSSFQEEQVATDVAHPTGVGRLPYLALLWNQACGDLPKVKNTNAQRNKRVAVIFKEQTESEWKATIERMAKSNFCNGKNSTGWKATFDFLLKPDTWLKVNEGKYDNFTGNKSTRAQNISDNLNELEKRIMDGKL